MRALSKEDEVTQTVEEKNKAFVLEAFETLFNKRDYLPRSVSGLQTIFSTAHTFRPDVRDFSP
jgi:hypothetical protein